MLFGVHCSPAEVDSDLGSSDFRTAGVYAERMLSIVGRDDLAPIAAEVRTRLAAVVERAAEAG
jgi:hypothetical protein